LTSVTRLVLRGVDLAPGELVLPAEVARHARVARVSPGESIEVLNLVGQIGVGTWTGWDGRRGRVALARIEVGRGEPPAPLVLGLAVLHTTAFDWAVEKATELGVTAIVPVRAERSQVGRYAARRDRWRRVAEAAVAQCGRAKAPEVRAVLPLEAVLRDAGGLRVVADPGASPRMRLAAGPEGITLLVGPEGGFSAAEQEAIAAAGFSALSLGPRVLRAETAVASALTLVQSLAGWLA
jgi:16S rRNA (uracil1498-N3)-methyltransferase